MQLLRSGCCFILDLPGMCGINLVLDRKKSLSSSGTIRRMMEATLHRGPDYQNHLCLEQDNQQVFIANNRLMITDLSERGNQPMQCSKKGRPGDRFTLSYNGEIYNHYEIRNELLLLGYQFQSKSDTEVLLYALAEWKEAALTKVNGMFALAFYDKAEEQLIIARDRQGMKPLYYFHDDRYLIVSSEMRGILASGLVKKILNAAQIPYYLQYRYARKPETFYQDIYELLPGHLIKYRSDGSPIELIACTCKEKEADEHLLDDSSLIVKVEDKLTDSLFSHLESNRNTGIFLSGGIDSTLMLALLRNHSSNQIPDCFTIVNSAKEAAWGTQDYLWANRAATKYDARHYPVEIDSSLLRNFQSFLREQDQPIGDSAAWLTSLLAGVAQKQGISVVLSGAGADELFGGYNRHLAFYKYLQHYDKLQPVIPYLKYIGNILPTGRIGKLRKPLRLWKKILQNLHLDPAKTYNSFISFEIQTDSIPGYFKQKASEFKEGWMLAALEHDRKNYLVSDVLALSDKASMQKSVEMRMPYLSEEVYSLAEDLPASLLLNKGPKWLLAEVLKKNGGDEFTNRKKEGFGLPFGLWIKEGKTEFMWEWMQDHNNPLFQYIDRDIIQELLYQHKTGKEDYTQELFSIVVLGSWLSKEFS